MTTPKRIKQRHWNSTFIVVRPFIGCSHETSYVSLDCKKNIIHFYGALNLLEYHLVLVWQEVVMKSFYQWRTPKIKISHSLKANCQLQSGPCNCYLWPTITWSHWIIGVVTPSFWAQVCTKKIVSSKFLRDINLSLSSSDLVGLSFYPVNQDRDGEWMDIGGIGGKRWWQPSSIIRLIILIIFDHWLMMTYGPGNSAGTLSSCVCHIYIYIYLINARRFASNMTQWHTEISWIRKKKAYLLNGWTLNFLEMMEILLNMNR